MIETTLHPDTQILVFDEVPDNYRILKKGTLANGYGLYYDLFGNRLYLSKEAERLGRKWWRGMVVDGDYYIHIKEENEIIEDE